VGSLSYAIARTLPKAAPGTTYRALFAEITRALSGKVRQTPQVEGTIDAQLFSNRLSPQAPYIEVDTVVAERGMVALGGGSLMGLNVGTQEINDNEETMSGVEMGIQRAFFKNVLLDLGTRHAYSSDREFWEGQVYAGVNLMFAVSGRESDSEPRTAVDEPAEVVSKDSDGVIDARDDCPGTAPNAVVDDRGCQVYDVRREETIKTIYFEFDQSDIRDQFNNEVRSAAEKVRDGDGNRIRVEGHTDSIGTEEYNQGLSERRANSVRDELIQEYQVESGVIDTQGYGERRPVAPNDTAEGREQNRRADIVVESEEKEAQFKE